MLREHNYTFPYYMLFPTHSYSMGFSFSRLPFNELIYETQHPVPMRYLIVSCYSYQWNLYRIAMKIFRFKDNYKIHPPIRNCLSAIHKISQPRLRGQKIYPRNGWMITQLYGKGFRKFSYFWDVTMRVDSRHHSNVITVWKNW